MKVLSRDFTLREKVTISLLLIIVLCLGYKFLIHDPLQDALISAESQKETLQTEIMILEAKVNNLEQMKQELDEILNDPSISQMPSYNNIKSELAFLNNVLALSKSYQINVADVTRVNDQIRRDITIQFTTNNFDTTKEIIRTLAENRDRSLISNIQLDRKEKDSEVSCALLVTFYETMVGGTPDTGLPVESK